MAKLSLLQAALSDDAPSESKPWSRSIYPGNPQRNGNYQHSPIFIVIARLFPTIDWLRLLVGDARAVCRESVAIVGGVKLGQYVDIDAGDRSTPLHG